MKKNLKVMIGTVATTMTIKLYTLNAAAAGNDAAGKLKMRMSIIHLEIW